MAVSELLSLRIEARALRTDRPGLGRDRHRDRATAASVSGFSGSPRPVVAVDLTEVPFVESSGIAVLIAEHKRRVAVGGQP